MAQEVSLDQVEDATQELLSLLQQPREYAGTCSWQSWNGSHRQLWKHLTCFYNQQDAPISGAPATHRRSMSFLFCTITSVQIFENSAEQWAQYLTIISNNKSVPWSCNKSLANFIPILFKCRLVLPWRNLHHGFNKLFDVGYWYHNTRRCKATSSQLARLDKTFLIFWLSLIRLNAATTSANYFGPSCSKKPQSSFSNIISVTAWVDEHGLMICITVPRLSFIQSTHIKNIETANLTAKYICIIVHIPIRRISFNLSPISMTLCLMFQVRIQHSNGLLSFSKMF